MRSTFVVGSRTRRLRRVLVGGLALALLPSAAALAGTSTSPAPGSPAYVARDAQNVRDAYGRQTAPDGQLTPQYITALQRVSTTTEVQQLLEQAARPNHPAVTPGNLAPGWNVGNPYRENWNGTRGRIVGVRFPNRYGAQLVGDMFAPRPGARDPYTGKVLSGPFPAVVITPGSVQGSERMYWWLAEDLAERGYVVLTFDTQGQGRSETFPHQPLATNVPGQKIAPDVPYCDPLLPPARYESNGCPGVPSQQAGNFVVGTEDALSFLLSTPGKPYRGTPTSTAQHDPFWQQIDRRPDPTPNAAGRTAKVAVIGHSLGAFAVSYLQGVDRRISTVVALDKLSSGAGSTPPGTALPPTTPVVPALGIQSEYGFSVAPYVLNGGSSLSPQPNPPNQAPDPQRELKTGYDAWRAAGVDSMVLVPRSSTHLEYTDIPLALPASRYGQDVASHYAQAWLDKYLKDDPAADGALLATRFSYLEPTSSGTWKPVTLDRSPHLSYQFCSAWSWARFGGGRAVTKDANGVGC